MFLPKFGQIKSDPNETIVDMQEAFRANQSLANICKAADTERS